MLLSKVAPYSYFKGKTSPKVVGLKLAAVPQVTKCQCVGNSGQS